MIYNVSGVLEDIYNILSQKVDHQMIVSEIIFKILIRTT